MYETRIKVLSFPALCPKMVDLTSKAVSNWSQGTASQLGYAFSAADSLYAP